jgi:transcriptional regulator with XRE-family HTH domain
MRLREAVNEEIRDRLRQTLAELEISAYELSRRCGWSQPYISRRMTGRTPWRAEDLALIADALNVPITKLLTERNVS